MDDILHVPWSKALFAKMYLNVTNIICNTYTPLNQVVYYEKKTHRLDDMY